MAFHEIFRELAKLGFLRFGFCLIDRELITFEFGNLKEEEYPQPIPDNDW